MDSNSEFSVFSEVGALRQVMLHRPGAELNRLTVDNIGELLFDDLIWLEQARKEHDQFAKTLASEGDEILYFSQCLAEVLKKTEIRAKLIADLFRYEGIDRRLSMAFTTELMNTPAQELANHLIGGYTRKEVKDLCKTNLSIIAAIENGSEFLIHPLPNLYFQRDPASIAANGIIIGQMSYGARRVEPLYWQYLLHYHPRFKGMNILFGDAPDEVWPNKFEGGDLLVLSDTAVAIGVSQRTAPTTVQRIGRNLASRTSIKRIFAFEIPKERHCMHLDTVLTMVDRDAFCIYPPAANTLRVWQMDYNDGGQIVKLEEKEYWTNAVANTLGFDNIRLIKGPAGGTEEEIAREQWQDAYNTLAVSPGTVVMYNRNVLTKKVLEDNGIKVLGIDVSELCRGRGGPRCMSMPLNRAPL